MMATTQVQIYPPPSTSSRSASPFHVPLSLSLSPFSPLFLPLLVARFSADTSPRYRLSSTPRHFRFRWSNQPIWVRFFDPPATFTQHTSPFYSTFAIIRTRPYVCPFIRPVLASVSRLTHLRPISRGAKRWWIPMIEPGTWRRDTILNQANCSRFIIDEVCIKWFLVWRERKEERIDWERILILLKIVPRQRGRSFESFPS